MRAFRNTSTNLYELRDKDKPVPNIPKFKRFVGGIGWNREDRPGDLAKTWITLFGEQEDDRITQIAEEHGTLQAVGIKAINLKDQFLCDRFYVDASDVHNQKVRYLRSLEGLTHYKQEKGLLRTIYPTDTKTWPLFRASRPTAAIVPVLDDVRVDIAAGFSLIHELATQQHKLVFYGSCEKLADLVLKSQVKERKPDETYGHPLVAASVFAVAMLLRTREVPIKKKRPTRNPYPNRAR